MAEIKLNPKLLKQLEDLEAAADRMNRQTPLHIAVREKSKATVERLISEGVDLFAENRAGSTAFSDASSSGQIEILRVLLAAIPTRPVAKRKLKAVLSDAVISAAISDATQSVTLDCINELMRAGAELKHQDSVFGTALMAAVTSNKPQTVKHLIENGADVNIRHKKTDHTALYFAARDNRIEIATMLLKAGADPNLGTDHDGTPLHEAVRKKKPEMVKLLLEHGADVNAVDINRDTPLALGKDKYASMRAKPLEIAGILMSYGGKEKVEATPEFKERLAKWDAKIEAGKKKTDKKWGPEVPQPDFSKEAERAAYKAAIAELEKLCGSAATAEKDLAGLFLLTNNAKKLETEQLQKQYLEKGCFVFNPDSLDRTKLAVLPTTDKYQVIAAMQTNGANYGIGTGGVIEWLKALEKEQPFTLTAIGFDVISGQFEKAVKSPAKLAKRLYEFCPDIVDQGCGDVEALAAELKKTRRLYLWWD